MAGLAPGVWTEIPGFGWPTAAGGTPAPGVFGAPAPAGPGVTGVSFGFGLGAPGTGPLAPGGAGGLPLAPGTGNALAFGKALGATLAGDGALGAAPGAPGLIAALGGTGSLPCWISVARCATDGGNVGPAPGGLAPPGPAPGPTGPGAGGRLMTLLMTVVLWMLAKMMLFGGGET